MHQVAIILFLVFGVQSFRAEPSFYVEEVRRLIQPETIVVDPPYPALRATEMLWEAYVSSGEYGLDEYLDRMDASWFGGIDVYIHQDFEMIKYAIMEDAEAQFRTNTQATVMVAHDNTAILVVIYSFP